MGIFNTYEYVSNYIEDNSNLILLSKEYIDNKTNLIFKCDKGHIFNRTFGNFQKSKKCPICRKENNKGHNNSNWNPNLTQEEREIGRKIEGYSDWVYSVFKRDKYICQCCGKNINGNGNAHHLDGYNWCKEKRLDLTNGVTLCGNCHINFHKEYGFGDNTEQQFIFWILENGKGIFDIDDIKKEVVLQNKPKKKSVIEYKEYYRKYYENNTRKYSESELDEIFNDVILENYDPKYLTTKGYGELTGINAIAFAKTFKTDWLTLLNKYGKLEILYKYVLDEYLNYYLKDYCCDFSKFYKNHNYITQYLVSLFTIEKIKLDLGFKSSSQKHNLKGLRNNFHDLIKQFGRIPFYNEFIKYTRIPIKSYLMYFNMEKQDYNLILKLIIDDKDLMEDYNQNQILRNHENAVKGGISNGKKNGYTDKEVEIEFKRVFDSYFNQHNKYPTKREFNMLSSLNDNTYRKKYKISWNEVKKKYNYSI